MKMPGDKERLQIKPLIIRHRKEGMRTLSRILWRNEQSDEEKSKFNRIMRDLTMKLTTKVGKFNQTTAR